MDLLMPVKLEKWEDQGIKIHWNDGHISQYRSGWLRASCPCREVLRHIRGPIRKFLSGGRLRYRVVRRLSKRSAIPHDSRGWLVG